MTDVALFVTCLVDLHRPDVGFAAIHKTEEQVSDLFHDNHGQFGLHERLLDRGALVDEARKLPREKFRATEVGITGVNFLIAETGQQVLLIAGEPH